MVKKLKKHNDCVLHGQEAKQDGLAFVIDKTVLDALGIDQKTDLEMIVMDDALIIKPKNKKSHTAKKRKANLKDAADRIMDKYEPLLKKLAKT